MPKKRPDQSAKASGPIDLHIGEKIREARKDIGMNQTDLGAAVGTTFQQIQKYETGRNRIAASRLYQMCKVLEIDMMSIFQSLPKALR
jgi:transcriptional regulator with XRE-family HTH domain